MNCRQWVVDVYAGADALTLNGGFRLRFPVSSFWFPEVTRNRKLETASLVLFRHCARQIDHGEQDENVCLQERHADVQPEKYDRHAHRNHGKESHRDQIAGKHVRPKAYGQRKDSGQMAHDLDGQHPTSKRNPNEQRHAGIRRPQEMRGVVSHSLLADSLDVVVDERADGAAKRNYGDRGRRFETWNQTDEVAEKDE